MAVFALGGPSDDNRRVYPLRVRRFAHAHGAHAPRMAAVRSSSPNRKGTRSTGKIATCLRRVCGGLGWRSPAARRTTGQFATFRLRMAPPKRVRGAVHGLAVLAALAMQLLGSSEGNY